MRGPSLSRSLVENEASLPATTLPALLLMVVWVAYRRLSNCGASRIYIYIYIYIYNIYKVSTPNHLHGGRPQEREAKMDTPCLVLALCSCGRCLPRNSEAVQQDAAAAELRKLLQLLHIALLQGVLDLLENPPMPLVSLSCNPRSQCRTYPVHETRLSIWGPTTTTSSTTWVGRQYEGHQNTISHKD